MCRERERESVETEKEPGGTPRREVLAHIRDPESPLERDSSAVTSPRLISLHGKTFIDTQRCVTP